MKQVPKIKSEASLTSSDVKTESPLKDPFNANNIMSYTETNPNAYDIMRAHHNNSITSVESVRNEE